MSPIATTSDAPISAAQIRVVVLCALVTLIEGIDLTLIPLLGPKIIQALSLPILAPEDQVRPGLAVS